MSSRLEGVGQVVIVARADIGTAGVEATDSAHSAGSRLVCWCLFELAVDRIPNQLGHRKTSLRGDAAQPSGLLVRQLNLGAHHAYMLSVSHCMLTDSDECGSGTLACHGEHVQGFPG